MKHRKLFYFICIFTIFSNSYLLCGDNDGAHGSMTDKQFQQFCQWLNENQKAFQVNNTNYTQQVGNGAFVLPADGACGEAFKKYFENQHSWNTYCKKGVANAISQAGGNVLSHYTVLGIDNIINYILGPSKEEELSTFMAEGMVLNNEITMLANLLNNVEGAEDNENITRAKEKLFKVIAGRLDEYKKIHNGIEKSKPVETKQAMDKKHKEAKG